MDSTGYNRAVAAATGRRFESCRPDSLAATGTLRKIVKIKLGIVGSVLFCIACALCAQDAAQSSVDLGSKVNQPERTPEPTKTVEPPKPIEPPEVNISAPPAPAAEVPELSELDAAFKQS